MSKKSLSKLSANLMCQDGKQCKPPSTKAIVNSTLLIILIHVLAIKGVMGLEVHMGVSDFGLLGKDAWFFCNYSDNGESIIGLEWFFSPDPSDLGTAIMSYDPYNHDVQVSRNWERRIQFPDKSSNTSFTISPLERGDQGVYRCTVVGDDTVTKEKYLEVYDPPDEKDGLKVVEDFRPIAVGETQVYTCQSSNSSPPATLMWYINDSPISNENILLNKPITDPNTGLSTSVMKIKIVGSADMEGAKLACRATFPRQPMKEWVRVIKVTSLLYPPLSFPYPIDDLIISNRLSSKPINQVSMLTKGFQDFAATSLPLILTTDTTQRSRIDWNLFRHRNDDIRAQPFKDMSSFTLGEQISNTSSQSNSAYDYLAYAINKLQNREPIANYNTVFTVIRTQFETFPKVTDDYLAIRRNLSRVMNISKIISDVPSKPTFVQPTAYSSMEVSNIPNSTLSIQNDLEGNGRTRNTIIHPIFFVTTPMMTPSSSMTSMSGQDNMITSMSTLVNATFSDMLANSTFMSNDSQMTAILNKDDHMMMMTDQANMSLMDKVSMYMTTPMSNFSLSNKIYTNESLMPHMIVTSDSMVTLAEVVNVTGMSETTILMNESADHMIMMSDSHNSSNNPQNILQADHSAGTVSILGNNMSSISELDTLANQSSRMKIDDINQMLMSTTLFPGATAPVRNDMGKTSETKKSAGCIITGQYIILTSTLALIVAKFF